MILRVLINTHCLYTALTRATGTVNNKKSLGISSFLFPVIHLGTKARYVRSGYMALQFRCNYNLRYRM